MVTTNDMNTDNTAATYTQADVDVLMRLQAIVRGSITNEYQ
jgi:hypothetical protein